MIVLIIILAIFLGRYYKKYHEFDEVFPRTLLMTAVVYFVISTLYIIISYSELATLKEKRTKIVIVDKDKYTIGDDEHKFGENSKILLDSKSDSSFVYKKYVDYFSNQNKPWLIFSIVPEVTLEEKFYIRKEDWNKFKK